MKKVKTTSKKIHTFTAIDAKCGATGMEYGVASLLRQGVDRGRAVDRKLCPPCGSAEPEHARPAPGLAGELLLELGRIMEGGAVYPRGRCRKRARYGIRRTALAAGALEGESTALEVAAPAVPGQASMPGANAIEARTAAPSNAATALSTIAWPCSRP